MGIAATNPFRPVELGDVLSTGAKVIGTNSGALVVIAALFQSPVLLFGLFVGLLAEYAEPLSVGGGGETDMNRVLIGLGGGTVAVVVLSVVLNAVSQGAIPPWFSRTGPRARGFAGEWPRRPRRRAAVSPRRARSGQIRRGRVGGRPG
ncbi:MAG: hypothetical protein JW751_17255 [Polyangiaceae bacterium]|nr:hypothetical protein [Polyangiaceae bacterium]